MIEENLHKESKQPANKIADSISEKDKIKKRNRNNTEFIFSFDGWIKEKITFQKPSIMIFLNNFLTLITPHTNKDDRCNQSY